MLARVGAGAAQADRSVVRGGLEGDVVDCSDLVGLSNEEATRRRVESQLHSRALPAARLDACTSHESLGSGS